MRGVQKFEIKGYQVEFDFEKYTCSFRIGLTDEREKLNKIGNIENDEEYQFLKKCLFAKYDYEKGVSQNQEEYTELLGQFIDRYYLNSSSHSSNIMM